MAEFTEKEVVLLQRDAYRRGASDGRTQIRTTRGFSDSPETIRKYILESEKDAALVYPLPKVRRNRTVVIESGVMRFKHEVQYREDIQGFSIKFPNGDGTVRKNIFSTLMCCAICSSEAAGYWELLRDLQQNPTELVDAE